jgi:hypothetical protein
MKLVVDVNCSYCGIEIERTHRPPVSKLDKKKIFSCFKCKEDRKKKRAKEKRLNRNNI